MPLFDAYIVVDWSASSKPAPAKPSPNAVWVGEQMVDRKLGISLSSEDYFTTRSACMEYLRVRLRGNKDAGHRVFLGFEFAYGYPAGFVAAVGLPGAIPPWRRVWDGLTSLIEDHADNSNNRFAVAGRLNRRCGGKVLGPFWGRPKGHVIPGLTMTSPAFPFRAGTGHVLEPKRATEQLLPGTQPTWKLFGAGSVGGQTLLVIPVVAALRDDSDLRDVSRVWPFETGFGLDAMPPGSPAIVHVEVWQGVVNDRLDPSLAIRDQAEVRAMAEWLAELDMADELRSLFGRPLGLPDGKVQDILDHEGWISGAGFGGVESKQAAGTKRCHSEP